MGSYKKIGLSHEMGLIDTPPLTKFYRKIEHNKELHRKIEHNEMMCHAQELGSYAQGQGHNRVKGQIVPNFMLLIHY